MELITPGKDRATYKMKRILFIISGIVLASSCTKTYDCTVGGLSIGLTTLNPNQNDTVYVRGFEKGSNFATLIQENTYVFVHGKDSVYGITNNGTTVVLNGYSYIPDDPTSNSGFLVADSDFEVEFGNNLYRITQMQIEERTETKQPFTKKKVCFSPVYQFNVNDVQKTIPPFSIYFLE